MATLERERRDSYSSSFSESDSESSVSETVGLGPVEYDEEATRARIREANEKLKQLNVPGEESRSSSKIRFNDQVAVKSSSSDSDTSRSVSRSSSTQRAQTATTQKANDSVVQNKNNPTAAPAVAQRKDSVDSSSSGSSSFRDNGADEPLETQSYTADFETGGSQQEQPTKASSVVVRPRPKSAPTRSQRIVRQYSEERRVAMRRGPKAKILWEPGHAPVTPNDLPNYMRPQTGLLKRNRRQGATLGRSQEMDAHMKQLDENFPGLSSAYAMPKEQREAVAKRDRIRRQRIKEENAFRQEEKQEQDKAAHEVWCAWYEVSLERTQNDRAESRRLSREERMLREQTHDDMAIQRTESGLDFDAWEKSKLKQKSQTRKKQADEEARMAAVTPTPLQRMKMNDKAFRKWMRQRDRDAREQAKMEKQREKMRRRELIQEAKAKKMLESIRAAKALVVNQASFVF